MPVLQTGSRDFEIPRAYVVHVKGTEEEFDSLIGYFLREVMMKKGDTVKIQVGDTTYKDIPLKVKEIGKGKNAGWVLLENSKWYHETILLKIN